MNLGIIDKDIKKVVGRDPLKCPFCGTEMKVWKIWHPIYGVIYDEEKNIRQGKYKNILNQEIEEEVPFGGAPEYYKYRCSHCHFENTMNEANVDVAFGWTKKRTKCSRGLMPVLECPICSCLTYECVD